VAKEGEKTNTLRLGSHGKKKGAKAHSSMVTISCDRDQNRKKNTNCPRRAGAGGRVNGAWKDRKLVRTRGFGEKRRTPRRENKRAGLKNNTCKTGRMEGASLYLSA